MAAVIVDPTKVHEFADAQAFYTGLGRHDQETEVWIKIHKVNSGLPSITTPKEAIDVVLCWGWSRAQKGTHPWRAPLPSQAASGASSTSATPWYTGTISTASAPWASGRQKRTTASQATPPSDTSTATR